MIHCSVDSYVHNGWSKDHLALPPVDLRVLAEADPVVRLLLPLIEHGTSGKPKAWEGVTLMRPTPPEVPKDNGRRPITNHDLARMLASVRGDRKFTLARVALGWAGEHYPFREPLDYLGTDGGGGLGSAPGMAVGVGLALRGSGPHPDLDHRRRRIHPRRDRALDGGALPYSGAYHRRQQPIELQ